MQLAIMREAKVEIEDHSDELCIWFSTFVSEGSAALQVVGPSDERFMSLWNAMHGEVKNLNGRACWVDTTRPGIIQFDSVAKI